MTMDAEKRKERKGDVLGNLANEQIDLNETLS